LILRGFVEEEPDALRGCGGSGGAKKDWLGTGARRSMGGGAGFVFACGTGLIAGWSGGFGGSGGGLLFDDEDAAA
jgi:hypothetical protein